MEYAFKSKIFITSRLRVVPLKYLGNYLYVILYMFRTIVIYFMGNYFVYTFLPLFFD